MISAKVVADSMGVSGIRITTMELVYPRWILAEFNTHRQLSRNSASSRAIPTIKIMRDIIENPAVPTRWRRNQKGMQGGDPLDVPTVMRLNEMWMRARDSALQTAWAMQEEGLAKETLNRILEPFMHARTLVTATDWQNFFDLRLHPDAQPEFHDLAKAMRYEMDRSKPRLLQDFEWHKPYSNFGEPMFRSVARAARVSYKTHDNKQTTFDADAKLAERLLEGGHMSPFEHQARSMGPSDHDKKSNNFTGWVQLRAHMQENTNGKDILFSNVDEFPQS